MLKIKCVCSKSKVKSVKTMSSRGAIIANNIVTSANVILQSILIVNVMSHDVGISRKRPCNKVAFQRIATLRQNQSHLAITQQHYDAFDRFTHRAELLTRTDIQA